MASTFDPGALLAHSYAPPGGPRVILRLARVRDLPGIERLLAREGQGLSRFELERLLRSHPRARLLLCATALIGGAETIVGFGSVGLDRAHVTPTLIVADTEQAPGVGSLLGEALLGRAEALAQARAA